MTDLESVNIKGSNHADDLVSIALPPNNASLTEFDIYNTNLGSLDITAPNLET